MMERRKRLGQRNKKPKEPSTTGTVTDAERTGGVPLQSAPSGGGGSVMGGVVTEGAFLRAPGQSFIDSPFGQRYVSVKPKAVVKDDILLRMRVDAFSVRGYLDSDSPAFTGTSPDGILDGELLLQDWYQLVRDMGKRSLKYKHLPVTLTDTDMLIYYLDVYFYVVANLTTLLNLNRLPMWNAGFAVLLALLPRYMSRIIRLWRRTSAIAAPTFLKAHAVRNGMIVSNPGSLAPTMRLWNKTMCLRESSGGPLNYAQDVYIAEMFGNVDKLGNFIADLEAAERWLEVGATLVADDFVAMRDLIDMTFDVVPGSFVSGLPDSSSMPGIVNLPDVRTDILLRAVFRKDVVGAGTDQWIIFPIPGEVLFGGRIPVAGFGAPTLYDYILLGAPKMGQFESVATRIDDVDSMYRIPGTDFPVTSQMSVILDMDTIFGDIVNASDEALKGPVGAPLFFTDPIDKGIAASIVTHELADSLRSLHAFDNMRYISAGSDVLIRMVDEARYDYIMWQDPEDIGANYAEFLAKQLGVPYMRGV